MSPEVAASIWAVGGSIGTFILANIFTGIRMKQQLEAQEKQMNIQLEAQKKQMNLQLEAQAKQTNEQLEFQREERSFQIKQALINNSYIHRTEAYTKLSSSLYEFDRYLRSFIGSGNEGNEGNEFADNSNSERFAPLEYKTKIWDCYIDQSLWLSQDVRNALYQFFIKCNLGISLASNLSNDDPLDNGLDNFCIDMIVEIGKIRDAMKEDLGITYADDFKDRKQSKSNPLEEASATRVD